MSASPFLTSSDPPRHKHVNPFPPPVIPAPRGIRAFPPARSMRPSWPLLEAAQRRDACHGLTPEGFCIGGVIRGPAPSAAVWPCLPVAVLRMAFWVQRS